MSSKILFVFEGAKTEKNITRSFAKSFPNEDYIIECAYCTTIYNLYNKIVADEYLDTFSLLKEVPFNKDVLKPYTRNDFAEIYLFFDYDGHTNSADDEKLIKALALFNEETEFGKIYINYPMVESLRHCSDNLDFKTLKVEAKKNIEYKKIVNNEGDKKLQNYLHYTKETWIKLIDLHLKKMNYIVNGNFEFPSYCNSQDDIFFSQFDKYINIDCSIAVLNSFPMFLFEYYGYENLMGQIFD